VQARGLLNLFTPQAILLAQGPLNNLSYGLLLIRHRRTSFNSGQLIHPVDQCRRIQFPLYYDFAAEDAEKTES
jgi:hypothetical protein